MNILQLIVSGTLLVSAMCQVAPGSPGSRVSPENRFRIQNFLGRRRNSQRSSSRPQPTTQMPPLTTIPTTPRSSPGPSISVQELEPVRSNGLPNKKVAPSSVQKVPPYRVDENLKTSEHRYIPLSQLFPQTRRRTFPPRRVTKPPKRFNEPYPNGRHIPLSGVIIRLIARRRFRTPPPQRPTALPNFLWNNNLNFRSWTMNPTFDVIKPTVATPQLPAFEIGNELKTDTNWNSPQNRVIGRNNFW